MAAAFDAVQVTHSDDYYNGCPTYEPAGSIMYNTSDETTYVSVYRYNSAVWSSLRSVSKKKFGDLQYEISDAMTQLMDQFVNQDPPAVVARRGDMGRGRGQSGGRRRAGREKRRVKKGRGGGCGSGDIELSGATMDMINELYASVSDEKKTEMREKYADSEFFKNRCKCCDSYMEETYTCLHGAMCTGMCKACYTGSVGSADGVAECPSCAKEQAIECPICTECKGPKELLMSKNCCHGVCLGCFADSYRTGHTIDKCPMCRADFH